MPARLPCSPAGTGALVLSGEEWPWEPGKTALGVPRKDKNKPPRTGKWPLTRKFGSKGKPYLL